jgi:hypothetical protein
MVARDGIEPPTPAFSGPPDRNVQVISVPLRRFRADKNVQGLSIAGAKRGPFKSYEFRNVVAVVTDNPVFKELRGRHLSEMPIYRPLWIAPICT